MRPHPASPLRGRAAALAALAALCGCEAQGIPLDEPLSRSHRDAGEDVAPPAERDPDRSACEPGLSECIGYNVRSCNERGTDYAITACPEQCRQGACVPYAETCAEGQLVALSHDAMFFEVDGFGKPVTSALTLTHCGSEPLVVHKASIVGNVEVESERAVFDWSAESASLQGATLMPGDVLELKVRFTPRSPRWREDGTLYLTFHGGPEPFTREISLRTHTTCVGATPLMDLGDLEVGRRHIRPVTLHNCGTRALLLSGSALEVAVSPSMSAPKLSGNARPTLIAAGESIQLEVELEPEAPGPFVAHLDLIFSPRDQARLQERDTIIPVIARAVPAALTCETPDGGAPLELLLNGAPLPSPAPSSSSSTTSPLPLYEIALLTLARQGEGERWEPIELVQEGETIGFDLTNASASASALYPVKSPYASSALFLPTTLGEYTLGATYYWRDEELEAFQCERIERTLSASARGDYTVELEWYSPDDPVRDDVGAGHGVDLDLRIAFEGARGEFDWREPSSSCSASWAPSVCAGSRGDAFFNDLSGAMTEAVALYPTALDERVMIGVHAQNMAGFEAACATVKVWRGEQLIAELPSQPYADSRCEERSSRRIERGDTFWLLGSLDLASGQFDDTQESFLPRGLP